MWVKLSHATEIKLDKYFFLLLSEEEVDGAANGVWQAVPHHRGTSTTVSADYAFPPSTQAPEANKPTSDIMT